MFATLHTSDAIALGAGGVAIFSLLVSVWSVVVARGANKLSGDANAVARDANKLSEDANAVARDALSHTARQTDLAEAADAERLRQEQARAVMEADISPLILTVQASNALFRPRVQVRNVGERDSGRTIVRVYMPAGPDGMTWEDEQFRNDRTRPTVDPEVLFHDVTTGGELQAQYIDRAVENVTPTMPIEWRVILPVAIPPPGEGRYRLPVRVTVRADHAEQPFEWTDYVQTEYGPPSH